MAYVSPDGKRMSTDEMQRLGHQAQPPQITPDDPPSVVMAKYKAYVDAVRKLDKFGGDGTLHFGVPPQGGLDGYFDYDPDELKALIEEWKGYRSDIHDDQHLIYTIQITKAPAPDEHASEMQAAALRAYGARMMNDNVEMLRYCDMHIDNLQGALNDYMAAEARNTANLGQQIPEQA